MDGQIDYYHVTKIVNFGMIMLMRHIGGSSDVRKLHTEPLAIASDSLPDMVADNYYNR